MLVSLKSMASSSLLRLNCTNPDDDDDAADENDVAAAADDNDVAAAADDEDIPKGLANITVRTSFSPPINPATITSNEGVAVNVDVAWWVVLV